MWEIIRTRLIGNRTLEFLCFGIYRNDAYKNTRWAWEWKPDGLHQVGFRTPGFVFVVFF